MPIVDNVDPKVQLETALSLARSVQAHINAIYIRRDPKDVVASIPETLAISHEDVDTIKKQGLAAEATAKATFEEWRLRNGLADAIVHHSLHTPFACWTNAPATSER